MSLNVPKFVTKVPGPRAKEVLAIDDACVSPSYTRTYPLVAKSGRGAMIEDVDGNLFLDCTAGIAVTSTGHCHPKVVAAIQKQAAELIHMSGTDFYYPQQADLAQILTEISPGFEGGKVFLTNSGAESVEAAIKLARWHTKRPQIISFLGSFHGRTMGALSATGSKPRQKERFFPLVPGFTHVPYPDPYRAPSGMDAEGYTRFCLDWITERLFKTIIPADEVAGILVEPIQGEGGYVIPQTSFIQGLRKICDDHGIMMIADEVQSGMGRTGKMLAIEHFGVVPDIVCLAKGIASGLPLGAIVARKGIMDWTPGSHANTFGGNPLACVAAMATIELLQKEYIENAATQGRYMLGELKKLMTRHPLIGDVRGLGLMIGVELVTDRKTKARAPKERDAVVDAAFKKGLLLLGCGVNTIRFSPPLCLTRAEVDKALELFEAALTEVEGK